MIPAGSRPWKLGELASALGLPHTGDPQFVVRSAGALGEAGPEQLSALYDAARLAEAQCSRAGALIVPRGSEGGFAGRPVLPSAAPKAAFARAIALLHPAPSPPAGVHATAVLAAGVVLGRDVAVGPGAVLGERCQLGDRVVVGAGAVLLADVEVGEETVIHPRAVIYPRTTIGPRCLLLAGCVVGAPGFGHAIDERGRAVRIPHLGRVVLEEEVEIGANATVDRASFGETRLKARSRIDNLVQVAHNCELGEDAMIAALSGLAGSSRMGRNTVMGGQSGLADHVSVGDGSVVAAKTAVFHDVGPGEIVAGIPAMPIARWRRIVSLQGKLPELWRALRKQDRGGPGRDGEGV
ncbi:MAG: UDP-3-O-(3-hydroxymyristoyl)glucosamine N-acyltransferase [Acidobacteria bacterium]|nr:UDP-3-O-(3-hydroxymyristoyl)glucosamine N-acyltransferase [Acidobacteriota bacterium]